MAAPGSRLQPMVAGAERSASDRAGTRALAARPRELARRCLVWLGKLLVAATAVVLCLAMVGALYETVASAQDAARYPPPGRMVDVGGYRLHVQCTGSGSPTVVLEAALGSGSP